MKSRKRNAAIVVYIIIGMILCALVGNALAKYFQSSTKADTVRAKEFYFSSDILDDLNRTLTPGVSEITFSLGNHEDELRYSEVDIEYTVTVTSEPPAPAPAIIYGTPEKKLAANSFDDQTVTLLDLQPNTVYTVTVTGVGGYNPADHTGGYSKTLTGRFTVPPAEKTLYKYFQAAGEYVLLTVWSQGYQGKVSIQCTADVLPDNTDPVMQDCLAGDIIVDTATFASDPYSSHTYRFFLNGEAVNVNSFIVTYNETETANYNPPS